MYQQHCSGPSAEDDGARRHGRSSHWKAWLKPEGRVRCIVTWVEVNAATDEWDRIDFVLHCDSCRFRPSQKPAASMCRHLSQLLRVESLAHRCACITPVQLLWTTPTLKRIVPRAEQFFARSMLPQCCRTQQLLVPTVHRK